ncbi:EAL domain-containing protein [uncultured Cohaesibacter sp.]|uniref:putative bifunctional diguanylate cyclase/phosphodiesterase n=1 Tax=uncultured Cohaesibacter sp. TaxID=1002546 RepID=UPI0029C66489|nr:EAL domain-containing protein [uncultured Cohaesibacter sp.]
MLNVLSCIYNLHNLPLVFLAAVICVFGSTVTMRLLTRGVAAQSSQRLGWHFLSAVAGGGSVWATHFVAMLSYEPQVPVSFDPALTVLSLVIAMAGLFFSFVVSGFRDNPIFAAIGGAFVGISFAVMHYTGMFAYRVVGLVEWNFNYILASVIIPVVCSATALYLIRQRKPSFETNSMAVGLSVLGIVALHFTGMTALTVTPMTGSLSLIDGQAVTALALAISVVTVIVLGTGLTSYLIDTNMREASRNELHYMAVHDPLTGLPNRSSFNSRLRQRIEQASASDRKLAVIGIDLNRFKEINDSMGHAAGDEALITLANRIRDCLRADEMIARIGGDEFAAIKCFSDRSEILAFTDRLAAEISQPIRMGFDEIRMQARFGVAVWPDDAWDLDNLVNNSGLAVCHAKDTFTEKVCFYDSEIGAELRKRRLLAESLRQAIEGDVLEVHYQVQKSLSASSEVHGFEALLRWTHPDMGPISPATFIPLAEENGLIGRMGAWVLRRACRDAAEWDPPHRVAVNVSAVQFMDPGLPKLVHEVLIETGLSPHRLELELTETALVKDKIRSLHIMRQIKDLGVGIALDDFGTGYSSLEILRTFPFDKIKLDKSFVKGIETDRQSKAIVRAVLALGKSLEIPVLAEGIETDDQMEILRFEGCDEGQGYFLGRPSPLEALVAEGGLTYRQHERYRQRSRSTEDLPEELAEVESAAVAIAGGNR